MSEQKTVSVFSEALTILTSDEGQGQTFVLLHGGAGPASMAGLAAALAEKGRAIVPTLPGFNGQPRPEWLDVKGVVLAYLALFERLDLRKVVLVGNSFGGWIAGELALRRSPRIAGMVLLNGVGIDTGSPDKHIVDPMAIDPAERMALSYHNPTKFAFTPSGSQLAAMAENQKTLRVYAGVPFMHDPALRSRLGQAATPTLVAWGESDRIVDADYGRRFAESIPGAQFVLVREAGHFPHIEQPAEVLGLIQEFTRNL